MCHGKWLRRDEPFEERRDERLWDLFYRETEEPPPPMPVAEREEEREPERERALSGIPKQ